MHGFDSSIYGPSFTDPDIVTLFGDDAELRAMVDVESALAQVQGELGIIPAEAAKTIVSKLETASLQSSELAEGTRRDGVVVPTLVKKLRQALPEDTAPYLHWGATSQDIVDTALVVRLAKACTQIEHQFFELGNQLASLAEQERHTVMVARTRYQWAIPTLAGLKVANWLAPLSRQLQRLDELKPRLLVVQLGGAAGTQAALSEKGPAVADAMAGALGLNLPPAPWHTQRDTFIEFANWLAMTTGILGKMGQDLILLTQSDVAEVRLRGSGGSSTMPQKANPVGPEALVTLARHNIGLLGNLHHTMVQAHERDGVAWALEWLNLPQLVCTTAGALNRAQEIVANIEFNRSVIESTLNDTRGTIMAEAMVFALSEHTDRSRAQKLVKDACIASAKSGEPVVDCLKTIANAPLDWDYLKDPANFLGSAGAMIDAILDEWRTTCHR